MFDVGPAELGLIVVIAIIILGPEKIPDLAKKTARVLHFLRNVANNAQDTLSRELGTDVDIRDLNPKTFVQKHLLDEVQPIIDDVKTDLKAADADLRAQMEDVKESINTAGENPTDSAAAAATRPAPFDPEAT